jgi:hypothetical protein
MIAVQKSYAHLALELGDALGDRGLGGVETLGGAPKTAELHHPEERLDRPEIQHAMVCLSIDKSRLSILIKKHD